MSDSKYSLLFMRDNSDVRRLRVSPFWLNAFFIIQAVLLVLAAVGLFLGITQWIKNSELTTQKRELSLRLEEAELKLSSLANMEKILEAYDKRDLQSLLNAKAEEGAGAAPGSEGATEPATLAVNLSEILARVDVGPIEVMDLKAQVNDNRLVVSFRMENPSESVASGTTKVFLVTNDGQVAQADTKENLSYQIQKRKFERATVDLPEGVNQDTLFGVRIQVEDTDGKTIFQQTYPLAGDAF